MGNKINQQGGLIPQGLMNQIAYDNILLLGDSACQVKATTGGGIIMLLTAAKFAANCIIKCFKNKNYSKKIIKKYYENSCKAVIGKELKIHYLLRTFLESCNSTDYDQLLQIIKTSEIKNVISIYGDMDFPKTLLFKLIRNPKIIRFLLRFLIRNPQFLLKLIRII
jgi:flavin-dependent dehydrogenase